MFDGGRIHKWKACMCTLGSSERCGGKCRPRNLPPRLEGRFEVH